MSFSVFSVDGISGNKGFMLSKLAGCWLAVTWVQNIAEFSDKRRLVCEPRFIASRSSHTPHHHYTIYTIYTLGHQTLNLEMGDTEVKEVKQHSLKLGKLENTKKQNMSQAFRTRSCVLRIFIEETQAK